VFWNVSVWNPYLVALLQTNVKPSGATAAAACSPGTRARGERKSPRFRWCASGE
jgi:hypothetical protein